MKPNTNNFFWPSFTDLMTSLFFIMLALYVLTYSLLRYQQKATEDQLRKIKEIQNAVKALPPDYFRYDESNRRFELRQQISFEKGQSDILPQYKGYLTNVGLKIIGLINNLKKRKEYSELGTIKYLIVIEGMASNDNYQFNYELSYKRSLALFNFWKANQIIFDPQICEIQIAGSGTGGVGRSDIEINNQRFLIQIIPKIGEIK